MLICRSSSPDGYKVARALAVIGDEFNIKDQEFGGFTASVSRPGTSASLKGWSQEPIIGHNAEERIRRRAAVQRNSSPPSEVAVREIMQVIE